MQYQLVSENLEITPSMKTLTDLKLGRLLPYFSDLHADSVKLKISTNKDFNDTFTTEVLLVLNGKDFIAKATNHNYETSVIDSIEIIERQIIKSKEKSTEQKWKKARKMKRPQNK